MKKFSCFLIIGMFFINFIQAFPEVRSEGLDGEFIKDGLPVRDNGGSEFHEHHSDVISSDVVPPKSTFEKHATPSNSAIVNHSMQTVAQPTVDSEFQSNDLSTKTQVSAVLSGVDAETISSRSHVKQSVPLTREQIGAKMRELEHAIFLKNQEYKSDFLSESDRSLLIREITQKQLELDHLTKQFNSMPKPKENRVKENPQRQPATQINKIAEMKGDEKQHPSIWTRFTTFLKSKTLSLEAKKAEVASIQKRIELVNLDITQYKEVLNSDDFKNTGRYTQTITYNGNLFVKTYNAAQIRDKLLLLRQELANLNHMQTVFQSS